MNRIGSIEQAERQAVEKIAVLKLEADAKLVEVSKKSAALGALASEKTKGFPWLAAAYDEYSQLIDSKYADVIASGRYKQRAAPSAAEKIREASLLRRVAEKESRLLKYQIKFYEALFPWLVDLRDDDVDDELIRIRDERGEEDADGGGDPSGKWVSKAEYSSPPELDRFQLALDRYWKSRRSKWEIGRDYERYIGYLYEMNGYSVSYHGIVEGLDDLGGDLICKKAENTVIIQCKNWAQQRVIHEKHIFQLYGTLIAYRYDNPKETVAAHFVTATSLSARAAGFADMLGMKVKAQQPLQSYPCIKCNISHRHGTKIFHLPFDQQYDKTTIDVTRGEFYATTVAEASKKRFRRAFRFSGLNNQGN